VPRVSPKDLSKDAIAGFRALAKQSRRLDEESLRGSVGALLEKLNLTENPYLKRAALLLFHPDPDRHFTGAYVKIGYFQSESDLRYHDEIHVDLFSQARKTMEILTTKYLKAAISYRGIQRIESLSVPEPALREAILNAIIHRDYAVGAPIQIRVYPDRLAIWNPGELPEHWSMKKLLGPHSSQPYNPLVANAFFRAGEIEAWGRGIKRILDACREAGAEEPRLDFDARDVWVEFPFPSEYLAIVPAASEARAHRRAAQAPAGTCGPPRYQRGPAARDPCGLAPCPSSRSRHAVADQVATHPEGRGAGHFCPPDEDQVGQLQPQESHDPFQHRPGQEAARMPGIRAGSRTGPLGSKMWTATAGVRGLVNRNLYPLTAL
jgi:hypothetical protein